MVIVWFVKLSILKLLTIHRYIDEDVKNVAHMITMNNTRWEFLPAVFRDATNVMLLNIPTDLCLSAYCVNLLLWPSPHLGTYTTPQGKSYNSAFLGLQKMETEKRLNNGRCRTNTFLPRLLCGIFLSTSSVNLKCTWQFLISHLTGVEEIVVFNVVPVPLKPEIEGGILASIGE